MTLGAHGLAPGVCVVAVDVGNSAVKLCVRKADSSNQSQPEIVPRGEALFQHSIRIDESNWPQAAIAWVRDHAQCAVPQWRIASVHREAVRRLDQAITQDAPETSIRHITAKDIPIEIRVDEPHRVGIDRLLGAYAAWNRYHEAVVVVDAGSAITVDWVDANGCFRGGAILPGLNLQTRSLATGTDALPELTWQSENVKEERSRHEGSVSKMHRLVPATNTSAAIRLGVLTGVAAAIDRLAQNYHLPSPDDEPHVANSNFAGAGSMVLTGGDSAIISPQLEHRHHVLQNLVCRGLLDLPSF